MGTVHEHGIIMRILKLVKLLIDLPFHYNIDQLARRIGVSKDTIKRYVKTLRQAGFEVECGYKHRYCYGFSEEREYQQLKNLLHFTEKDQNYLRDALEQLDKNSKQGERIAKKLNSLYDFQRLGHAFLRKPYLEKVDLLELANKEQRQVILEDYRSSNSNVVSNRLIEPFHTNTSDDILHAYDLDKADLRHFRISRIGRVRLLDTSWQYQKRHQIIATDPFRIVDNQQVMVLLRFKVGAFNEIIERFPVTEAYIKHDSEKDIYDFQCKVNHRFIGLTNFILGYHHQLVEIVYPESLIEHIQLEVKKIQEKLEGF